MKSKSSVVEAHLAEFITGIRGRGDEDLRNTTGSIASEYDLKEICVSIKAVLNLAWILTDTTEGAI